MDKSSLTVGLTKKLHIITIKISLQNTKKYKIKYRYYIICDILFWVKLKDE